MPATLKFWAAAAAAGLFLVSALWQVSIGLEARARRADIEALMAGRDLRVEELFTAGADVHLAQAVRQIRGERFDQAREILGDLTQRGGPEFRALSWYNLGNLYLRQALEKVERSDAGAVPLAEMAKEAYRHGLRADPEFADAKYNLEVATRLLPDFDPVDGGFLRDDEAARKLWPQLPGFPRGLP